MVPQKLVQQATSEQITKKLEDIYKVPRTKETASLISENLQQWLRLNRVKKTLEAPYQGSKIIIQLSV